MYPHLSTERHHYVMKKDDIVVPIRIPSLYLTYEVALHKHELLRQKSWKQTRFAKLFFILCHPKYAIDI